MRRLGLIGTGGTVAMTHSGDGARPTLTVASLGAAAFAGVGDLEVEHLQVFSLPSADLDLGRLLQLRDAIVTLGSRVDGIVVTHGTDTLEESAFALHLLLKGGPPVVLTGAMRTPDALGADGVANLAAAGRVALSPDAAAGVLVVLNDEIHSAALVRKVHSSRPSAFSSAPLGPLGWVAEDRVRILLQPAPAALRTLPAGEQVPHVAVLPLHADTPASLLKAAAAAGAGLVVELFGAGHAPARHLDLLGELAAVQPVVFASRTGGGETLQATYGFPGGEIELIRRGLVGAGALDARKARIALALLLSGGAGIPEIRAWFAAPADPG